MTKRTRPVEELEAMSDKELAEEYESTFDEFYPYEPTAYPADFRYGGITADPDFRNKAIAAISSGIPLPQSDIEDDPDVLY